MSLFLKLFQWFCQWRVCVCVCGINRALTDRFASWTEFHIICPTGGRRRDSVTEWQDNILEKHKKFREPKRSSWHSWRDTEKRTAGFFLDPHLRSGICGGLNETAVWICSWRNGHVDGGPAVRICCFSVHCFRCWACLPAGAAGFRGAHWQH